MKITRIIKVLVVVSWFLAGCGDRVATHEEAVKPIKVSEKKDAIVPGSWKAAESSGVVDNGWLKSFNDARLIDLVDEAQKNNFGLQIAAAEVERSNALARQAGAALKPAIGLSGAYSDRGSEGLGELYGAGLQVSWEADVWGRIRSGVAAAEEAAAASRSDYEYARQSLAAVTANSWFIAVGSKLFRKYTDDVVKLLEETLKIAEVKEKVGQGTMRDVHLARANLASAKEAAGKAKIAEENAKRSLEVILGRYPASDLETADSLATVPPVMATGIPSELLERRPDLIAAEQRVAEAFYKQEEAKLLRLPRFNFNFGLSAMNINDAVASLAAGIFAPVYTGGAIEAEVEIATAEQKKTIAAYAQSALQAFNEVETALAAEQYLAERQGYLKTVAAENLKAYQITQKQYEIGKIDLLDVLTIQQSWIQAHIALTDISTQRLLNRVTLHLALGGSFE